MGSNHMPTSLPEDRLETRLPDLKPPFDDAGAIAEANRCLYCHDAPCIEACPTDINVPEFIRKIATGNLRGSARTILSANILGHSCARVCPVDVLCQGACVFNHMDHPPIQIGRLQRHATDFVHANRIQFFHKGRSTRWRVAVVGGGPAGLACAHQLTRLGHEAVVFESRKQAGGLNTTGVAPYKMKAATSLEEVRWIADIGFEIRTGITVGNQISHYDLEREFDAIFLGVGLGPDGFLNVPGERMRGVLGAVDMIERIKTDPEYSVARIKRALVIGGGNTAIDAVRELRFLGIPEVLMVYRRDEKSMSGYSFEWQGALKEGARAIWHTLPQNILGVSGKVDRVRCVRIRPTEDGRGLEPIPDSQFYLATDLVVLAVGQERFSGFFSDVGVDFEGGRVQVDPETHQTSNPRYFAGGDCINGGKEVVNAAAEGKKAALGIHVFLSSRSKPLRGL